MNDYRRCRMFVSIAVGKASQQPKPRREDKENRGRVVRATARRRAELLLRRSKPRQVGELSSFCQRKVPNQPKGKRQGLSLKGVLRSLNGELTLFG